MATRAAIRRAAEEQGARTRSGRVPQERIDELVRPGLSQKDVRLRSIGRDARVQEARRRLNDPETDAGKPGTNLCRYAGDDKQMTGKRPGYYNKRNISANAVRLCKKLVDEAWTDPAFLKEEKIACGDDKKWVFAHKRGGKRVKGHCRNLNAPRPRAKKDPREKQLAALIRQRDRTSDIGKYSALDKQIKALRAEMAPKQEPVLTEPDDISQYDFTVVRPKQQPRKSPPKSRPAAGTRRAPTTITQSMQAYIDSLPSGEQTKARRVMTAYRNFGGLEPRAAVLRYQQRRMDDVQEQVGVTEFDDSGEEDQDIGELDVGGTGDGSRDDVTVPLYESLFPSDDVNDGTPVVPGAAVARQAMQAGQDRARAMANAQAEAQRAADEALVARFRDATLPQILVRNPERRDQLAAIFANLMRDEDMGGDGVSGGAHDAEHAELGDNTLDGSQLAEMLAGQGSALTITAY